MNTQLTWKVGAVKYDLLSTPNRFSLYHIIYDHPTCVLLFRQRFTLYYTV